MIIGIFGKQGTGKSTLNKKIQKILHNKTKKPIFYYSPYYDDDPSPDFRIKEKSIIGISELHIFLFRKNKEELREFYNIITGARHYDIDLIFDTQRPALIPRLFTSQCNLIYSFNISEIRDLEYLRYLYQDIEKIKNLKKFEYIRIL